MIVVRRVAILQQENSYGRKKDAVYRSHMTRNLLVASLPPKSSSSPLSDIPRPPLGKRRFTRSGGIEQQNEHVSNAHNISLLTCNRRRIIAFWKHRAFFFFARVFNAVKLCSKTGVVAMETVTEIKNKKLVRRLNVFFLRYHRHAVVIYDFRKLSLRASRNLFSPVNIPLPHYPERPLCEYIYAFFCFVPACSPYSPAGRLPILFNFLFFTVCRKLSFADVRRRLQSKSDVPAVA